MKEAVQEAIRHASFHKCPECGVYVTLVKGLKFDVLVEADAVEHVCKKPKKRSKT